MAVIDLTALARDRGFRRRVEFALFDVARDKAGATPTGDDLAFINGILNGQVNVFNVVMGVVVVNADPQAADDASIKATMEAIWPFYAIAWVAR